jgi:Sec-independent protein translocase protein TatA
MTYRFPVPETPRETRLTNRMQEPRPPAWLMWIGWVVIVVFGAAGLWTIVRAVQHAMEIMK